jgi:hypothetical protein
MHYCIGLNKNTTRGGEFLADIVIIITVFHLHNMFVYHSLMRNLLYCALTSTRQCRDNRHYPTLPTEHYYYSTKKEGYRSDGPTQEALTGVWRPLEGKVQEHHRCSLIERTRCFKVGEV